ncbi:hypothetical protein BDN72DRAFT_74132 [Pluteus cervinus]|uniref:Uncharacterized protein n=1 Tax=Pluteus cervinus TaxID=181527 RepID=A0ACD3API9_9AGAR|nr:hypothetical protein BDN72DRAFT_74132 [Pluteus cervinus]
MGLPVRAILIGIDQYPDPFPHLTHAVYDATAMESCLRFLGMTGEITLLTNCQATRDNIISTILSLTADRTLRRGDPILIFFSGLAGKELAGCGSICPVDAHEGGISDETLLQTLGQVVGACGNNITLFLDCAGEMFSWECPGSCTIFAPDTSEETKAGGIFTQALIKALVSCESTLDNMTPWSLKTAIQTAIGCPTVRCWGKNVNQPLFHSQGEQGHHAPIQCHQAANGSVILAAGAAHGVRTGAVYGAYAGNLKSGMARLAGLTVRSLNDDGVTSVLQVIGQPHLPLVFHAIEERGYADPVKVFIAGEGDERPIIENLAAWEEVPEDQAHVTAKKLESNKVSFVWNGARNYKRERPSGDIVYEDSDISSIRRFMRRAARFNSIVFAPRPPNSTMASQLRVQFFKADGVSRTNLLPSDSFEVGLDECKDFECNNLDTLYSYCLAFTNHNPYPLWLYILVCNPVDLTIRTWYAPPLGSYKPPLEENGTLAVHGLFSIFFGWQPDRNLDFLHIKIFATKEKTDFGFLAQWFVSPIEDNLRGFRQADDPISTISEEGYTDHLMPTNLNQRDPNSQWASRLITLVPRYMAAKDGTNGVED